MDNTIHSTHLEHLAREIKKGKAVLFVGAGMSLNVDPKTVDEQEKFLLWPTLSKKFQDELKGDYGNISPPKIIQLYEDQFNISERNRMIESGVPDKKYNPGSLHKELLNLEKFPWEAIVTTNIDSLIERTFDDMGVTYTRVLKPEDFANIKGIPIYKIHGTIDDPDTYTFSEKEYFEFGIKKPLFVSKLEQLFAESTFVFFGYSLSDPDLLEIQNRIHHRLGKFQRFSFLFSRSEDSVWNEYWKKKNVLLFNENIIATYTLKKINSPKMFIEESLEILYTKVKSLINIGTIKKTGEYLWRQNELRSALEERTNFNELRKVVSNFSSEYYGRISTTLEKEKLIEKNALVILDLLHEVVNKASQESELIIVIREALEEIFQIGDGFDKLRNPFILIIFSLVKKKNISKDTFNKLELCIKNFLFCIQKRIELGLGIGLDANFILRQIKFLRKQSDQEKFRNYYFQAYSYLFISGFGIREENVLRILKRLEKIFPEDNDYKLYISYRKAISFVYLSKWKDLRNFLETNPTIKVEKWNSLWTAFLWFELGEINIAGEIYESIIKSKPESLQRKYIALQAKIYLTNYSSYEKLVKNRKVIYELQQQFIKIEQKANKDNILLKDIDFDESEIERFIRKIQGAALEEERVQKNKNIVRFGSNSSIDLIHKTYERLWNLGIPSIPFAYSEIQKAVPSIFRDTKYLASLLEASMLVPIIDNWKNFDLRNKFQKIIWSFPNDWKKMQKRIWTVYRNTLDYAIEHPIAKGNSISSVYRIQERLEKAIELIGIALPWFDKNTFNEVFTYTLITINELINHFSRNRFDINKISSLISLIFYQSNNVQKRKIFCSFQPEFWSSWEGNNFFEDIKNKLPEKFWLRLNRVYKIELIKIESEENLIILMHLAFQIKKSEKKEFKKLKGIIERKLELYRKKRIGSLKKNIEEYNRLPDSHLHMRDYALVELDEFERKQDRISLLHSELILDSPADNLDYSVLLQKLKAFGSSGLSSSDLQILNLFTKMNLTKEQIEEIKNEINRYILLPKIQFDLLLQTSSLFKTEIIGYTSSFYLKFNQFEDWFTLQENYGYSATYYVIIENLESMREAFELDENKNFSYRFLNLFYANETKSQESILYFLYWFYKAAKKLYPQDWLLLEYLWNSPLLIEQTYLILPIMIIALKLEKETFQGKLKNYLKRLAKIEQQIHIYPRTAKTLSEFIDAIKSSSLVFSEFQELLELIERKIRILDFEFEGE